jgi:adenine phosphoribosyltransferase
MRQPDPESIRAIERAIRDIPDYPKPGILFKDITPVLGKPELLEMAVEALAVPYLDSGVTKVIGVEARGFILGGMLAHRLGAGFVPVRKRGKLPFKTRSAEYELEYGRDTIEMHIDAIEPSDRVLIHDDVIATGGTASASYSLAREAGAEVVGYAFLIELGFLNGRQRLEPNVPVHTLVRV